MYGLCASLGTPASRLQSSEFRPPGYRSRSSKLQLRAGGWSLQPHPGGFFLGRVRGAPGVRSRGLHPPWRGSWRLNSVILPRLGALGRHLALSWLILALLGLILLPSCSKMAPSWPNIAQHRAKMSQHGLQEHPQEPQKP